MHDLLNSTYQACYGVKSGFSPSFRQRIKSCVPFALDEACASVVTDQAARLFNYDIPKLKELIPLARLPFENVWLEWSMADQGDREGGEPIGFLFRQLTEDIILAECVFYGQDAAKPAPFAFRYAINLKGEEFPKEMHDKYVFLYTLESENEEDPFHTFMTKTQRALSYYIGVYLDVDQSAHEYELKADVSVHSQLVTALVALATINVIPKEITSNKRKGGMRAGGQIKEYLVNRVVSLSIPTKVRKVASWVERALGTASIRMRRHRVRGHWRVYLNTDGSVKRRTWIADHLRGDGALGFVNQVYEVKESD